MTAKEMFRELGYKYLEPTLHKESYFYYNNFSEDNLIIFYLEEKEILTSHNCESLTMDIKTFKAIHKQLEELGWLDD